MNSQDDVSFQTLVVLPTAVCSPQMTDLQIRVMSTLLLMIPTLICAPITVVASLPWAE